MRTVAEGVETKEQLGFLRTCNCNLIQGFYFDRPLPEEKYKATEDVLVISLCNNIAEE